MVSMDSFTHYTHLMLLLLLLTVIVFVFTFLCFVFVNRLFSFCFVFVPHVLAVSFYVTDQYACLCQCALILFMTGTITLLT